MAKHLKQLTSPISAYLKQRFSYAVRRKGQQRGHKLSPALEIAFLQGESLLRQRFFNYLEQHHFDDPNNQLQLWQQFHQGGEVFTLFCQSSGLVTAFTSQISEEYQQQYTAEQLQYTAYCCLLWDLKVNQETSALHNATERLFAHFMASIFPTEAAKITPEQLKREIRKCLAEQWQLRPEIKESYKVEDDHVEFSLLAHISGYHPKALIKLEGKRLKPTRLNACKELLQQLQQSKNIEPPTSREIKKSQKMTAL